MFYYYYTTNISGFNYAGYFTDIVNSSLTVMFDLTDVNYTLYLIVVTDSELSSTLVSNYGLTQTDDTFMVGKDGALYNLPE